MDFDGTSDFLITIASGLASQFADLSPTQISVITFDRSLYYFTFSLWKPSRIRETPSTSLPQLVCEITGIYRWRALATSQLFNRLDRYLRPKSLRKMRREEHANLVIILYVVFIGVCSTPPPTGKIAQESLDSLKQALLAYMRYIASNILLSDSQLNCGIHGHNFIGTLAILIGYQNLELSTGYTRSGMGARVSIYLWKRRLHIYEVGGERLTTKLTMAICNRLSVDRTTYGEVSQLVFEYFWKEHCPEWKLGVALAVLLFKKYMAGSDSV